MPIILFVGWIRGCGPKGEEKLFDTANFTIRINLYMVATNGL